MKAADTTTEEPCSVCCGAFRPSNPVITCPACPYKACRDCTRAYLLSTHVTEPVCMACRRAWDTAALHATGVGTSWVAGPLRAHRERVLWEQEQARLPETQPLAVLVARRNLLQRQCADAMTQSTNTQAALRRANDAENAYAVLLRRWSPLQDPSGSEQRLQALVAVWREARLCQLQAERDAGVAFGAHRDLETRVAALNAAFTAWVPGQDVNVEAIEAAAVAGTTQDVVLAEAPRQWRVLQGCPREGCRGYVTSLHKCGMCDLRVCRHCHGVLPVEDPHADPAPVHECNPDEVATAQALAASTKPCPTCAAPIYRVSGCNQMWCSQCRTAFDWVTGKTTTGPIHNPHYFAFLRQQGDGGGGGGAGGGGGGAAPGDLACATEAQLARVAAGSCLVHVFRVARELQGLQLTAPPVMLNNDMLRVELLLGTMTKDAFCSEVYLRERAWRRGVDLAHVCELFYRVVMDLVARLGSGALTPADAAAQADALVKYVNSTWQDLATLHKVCFPFIRTHSRLEGYPEGYMTFHKTGTKPVTRAAKRVGGAGAEGVAAPP